MTLADVTYALPIKSADLDGLGELTVYLRDIAALGLDVVVVDGSEPAVFAAHAAAWRGVGRHVPPAPDVHGRNGKARGVVTALRIARTDKVVVADDDVRYDRAALQRVVDALDAYAVVRPQNYFSPAPWHTVLDHGRTLIARVAGGDWPGTLGVRRSRLPHGYNTDVLFENLELVRAVVANGGTELNADDVFVARRPPATAHFWSQRVRQAYDEFARPARLAAALAAGPACCALVAAGGARAAAGIVAATIAVAEVGRRRGGATRYFSLASSLCAPLWALERAICAWLAVYCRVRYGGIRYAGSVIRDAATPRA